MKISTPTLLLIAAMSCGTALAQDNGWYVGGSFGQSKFKNACEGLTGLSGVSCDEKDSAWKLFGGYQFNRYIAAEVGYTDLGEAKASTSTLNDNIKTKAWELVAVGSYPLIEKLSVYGKLGVYRADTKERTNFGFSGDETNTDLTFAFGVRYDLTRNIGVRAEWQRYNDVGGGDIGTADIDVLSIGVLFRF